MGKRCSGHCCREFVLAGVGHTVKEIRRFLRERAADGNVIADMLVPLRAIASGTVLPTGKSADGVPSGGGWVFTCRHFNTTSNDCEIYRSRPAMCRDYPYASSCSLDGCTWNDGRGAHQRALAGRVHLRVIDASGQAA